MTCIRNNIVNQEEFITRFGINGGLTMVRGLDYKKIMAMDIKHLKLLFQPSNARFIRQFGLESIVNGYGTKNELNFIHDFINITELGISISCRQFKDKLLSKTLVADFRKRTPLRTEEGKIFLEIMLEMFLNNELEASITHPRQFGYLFGILEQDEFLKIITLVTKKLDLLEKISIVSMGAATGSVTAYFMHGIFPTLVRCLNPGSKEGRRIRGLRELKKHRQDVLTRRLYDYTPEEHSVLLSLLDKVANITHEKYSEEVGC